MYENDDLAFDRIITKFENLSELINILWVVICTLMILISQVGYMMKETGSIRMINNDVILLKTILVISVSSLTFFIVGYGFSVRASGGLFGDELFFG
jgi:Amt family ammonium transporter